MLSGKKINLRLFRDEADVRAVYDAYNELAERAPTDHTKIYPIEKRIEKFRETGFWTSAQGQFIITIKADEIVDATRTSEIVGTISFVRTTDFELEIGYRICRHKHRRKGFMSEALCLFSAYLFETFPHITRLAIKTAVNNVGSRKLAEKCGFTQEGVLRKAYFYRGEICDFVIYSLLREESPRLDAVLPSCK